MELYTGIPVIHTRRSRLKEVDFMNLEFGRYTSDHMLVCDFRYNEWQQPQIVPFTNLSLSPTTLALHYGQTVFEGMKAFRMADGRANIFRMEKHYDRFVKSLDRMCMAVPSKEIFFEGMLQLIDTDRDWIPEQAGHALYIRPFVIATEARFGVKISEEYRFIIFSGPVPGLYVDPIKVKVEREYIRAAKGGTGYAKCGGNYGGAFYPTRMAREEGYDQVLWTDALEHKYIEESGMMNVMFVINDTLVTAPVSDSILDGVTRDSLLTLAQDLGYKTEERRISINELRKACENGSLAEAFGAGTAAVIAPISTINIDGEDFLLPPQNNNMLSRELKTQLEDIRLGKCPDLHEWNFIV